MIAFVVFRHVCDLALQRPGRNPEYGRLPVVGRRTPRGAALGWRRQMGWDTAVRRKSVGVIPARA